MKVRLYDAQHVVGQIKRASPPTTKEMHKLINNLSILLEKNTEKIDSPLEAVLAEKHQALGERTATLCLLRTELAQEYAKKYADSAQGILRGVAANRERIACAIDGAGEPIEWNIQLDGEDVRSTVEWILGALKAGKSVVEDAIEESSRENRPVLLADAHLQAYLGSL